MSTPNNTPFYVGAIFAIVAIISLGIIVRRIRVRRNSVVHPQNFNQTQLPAHYPSPGPLHQQPLNRPSPSFQPSNESNPPPDPTTFPNYSPPLQLPIPQQTRIPRPVSSPDVQLDNLDPASMSLLERMEKTQNIMLEIHQLENDASQKNNSNTQQRIQDLRRRLAQLIDASSQAAPDTASNPTNQSNPADGPPPPYAFDGRG